MIKIFLYSILAATSSAAIISKNDESENAYKISADETAKLRDFYQKNDTKTKVKYSSDDPECIQLLEKGFWRNHYVQNYMSEFGDKTLLSNAMTRDGARAGLNPG